MGAQVGAGLPLSPGRPHSEEIYRWARTQVEHQLRAIEYGCTLWFSYSGSPSRSRCEAASSPLGLPGDNGRPSRFINPIAIRSPFISSSAPIARVGR